MPTYEKLPICQQKKTSKLSTILRLTFFISYVKPNVQIRKFKRVCCFNNFLLKNFNGDLIQKKNKLILKFRIRFLSTGCEHSRQCSSGELCLFGNCFKSVACQTPHIVGSHFASLKGKILIGFILLFQLDRMMDFLVFVLF